MATKKKAAAAAAPAASTILAQCADPHVGNHGRNGGPKVDGLNNRGRMTLDVFARAIDAARNAGARGLVVNGDLFHQAIPEPQIISGVQQALKRRGEMGVYLIPGNHDMLDASAKGGNTAMAPLWEQATVITEPRWIRVGDYQVLTIPFDARRKMDAHLQDVIARADSLPGYVAGVEADRAVLCTHVGLYALEDAERWMRGARDSMVAEELMGALVDADISHAFVGNYHKQGMWDLDVGGGRVIHAIQCGTLCPGGFGDEGLENRGNVHFLAYPGNRHTVIEIPGPRFIDAAPENLINVPPAPPAFAYHVRQVGGDPPTLEAIWRGWASLEHLPAKVEADAGDGAPPRALESPEEAISAAVRAHPDVAAAAPHHQVLAVERALELWKKSVPKASVAAGSMLVEHASLTDFFQWRMDKDERVHFLRDGLTFLIGKNGSGKSSLLEAPCWLIWGKTIRGTKIKGSATGTFQVAGSTYRIQRAPFELLFHRLAGRPMGGEVAHGEEDLSGQTPTETQAKIEEVFGTWKAFLVTRVFSGQRGDTFGSIANAERQGVVAALMPELDRFATASKAALADLKGAVDASQIRLDAYTRAAAVAQEAETSLADGRERLGAADVEGALREHKMAVEAHEGARAEAGRARAHADKCATYSRAAGEELVTAREAYAEEASKIQSLKATLADIRKLGDACPACRQAVSPAHRQALAMAPERAMEACEKIAAAKDEVRRFAADEARTIGESAGKAEARARALERELPGHAARVAAASQDVRAAEAAAADLKRLGDRKAELDAKVRDAKIVADAANDLQVLARAISDVLGPRGARVKLMGDALDYLSAEACACLAAIGSTIRVRLTPTKPRADGSDGAPQVHLRAMLNGAQFEHDELSGGERARVDVAILLALAKLRGGGGFLAFDEVFDPLDDEGLEGVASLLIEMARGRQVLVISHNPRLAALMPRGSVRRVQRDAAGRSCLVEDAG